MNTSRYTHYDDCRVLTRKGEMMERDCDCGVSYDKLYKRFLKLEEEYYLLTLRHNNLARGPISVTEAQPDFDIELDYGSD